MVRVATWVRIRKLGCQGGQDRPAHIHFRISYQGLESLTTRLLFADDPYLAGSFSLESPLVISLSKTREAEGSLLQGTFDIILPVMPLTPTLPVKDEDL